ncbi:type II toxin-antitoxin system RelE family toxin [Actinosynnema pretiosum]|uniref:type II toxin-antitoxin system RelE family toxin n=1 Tax=Actinosynnema pretiosum TaxID=42197 RepID=UPI0012FD5ADF|nr:type II toxin-antitoxin system RelE/ParE family toxin [Actinosynnema pretiosum]
MTARYKVVVSPAAQTGLDALPGRVAAAVVNFLRINLRQNPSREGVELRGSPLKGCLLAQRGQYRVIYKIDSPGGVVNVLQILPQR